MIQDYGSTIKNISEEREDILSGEAVRLFTPEKVIAFLRDSFPLEHLESPESFVAIADPDRSLRMIAKVLNIPDQAAVTPAFKRVATLVSTFGTNVIDASFFSPEHPSGSVPLAHASRFYQASASQFSAPSDAVVGFEHGAALIAGMYNPLALSRYNEISHTLELTACAFDCEASIPDLQWYVSGHEYKFPEVARQKAYYGMTEYRRFFWYCLAKIILEAGLLDPGTVSKRIGYFVQSLIDPEHIIQTGILGKDIGSAFRMEALACYSMICGESHPSDRSGCCLQ